MALNNSVIIIVIVVAFAFYLIYSQNKDSGNSALVSPFTVAKYDDPSQSCPKCKHLKLDDTSSIYHQSHQSHPHHSDKHLSPTPAHPQPQPNVTSVVIDNDTDPYSDPIKKQDMYSMLDPLTYPQARLSREVLEKYNEYYERNGSYPPFNQSTRPLFDNPILNGVLIKQVDENEPFVDNIPSSVPLFRVKSAKNTNKFFYYVIDQRYLSKVELKIPLDHVKINGSRYNNADFYGLPEIMDGDIIEHIPIYPGAKFKVLIYKIHHFP